MRTVTYRLADLNRAVIPLGFVGENNHTRVIFDASKVFAEYPAAVPALTVQPPQGTSYPAVVVRDGDYVHFDVSDSDLIHAGTGELQLAFVQDTVKVRTFIARTRIDRSIVPTGEIPEPLEDFLEAASAAVAAIPQEVADGVAEGFGAVTAEAETLAAGSDATAAFDTETKVLTIGVPVGADGQDGAPGADGFSPVASVTKSGDTATISITDKTGTTTATVKDGTDGQDGQPGADGYSPSASVSKSGATATITITDKSGTTTATVSDGTPVIDDTSTAADKVWSAQKVSGEVSDLNTALNGKQDAPASAGADGNFLGLALVNGQLVPVWSALPIADADNPGVMKVGTGSNGVNVSDGELKIAHAADSHIKQGSSAYRPITPYYQKYAVFYGLSRAAGDTTQKDSSNAVGQYTETAKRKITDMLEPQFRLIKEITITEETTGVHINTDTNGQSFSLKDVIVEMKDILASSSGSAAISVNSGTSETPSDGGFVVVQLLCNNSTPQTKYARLKVEGGRFFGESTQTHATYKYTYTLIGSNQNACGIISCDSITEIYLASMVYLQKLTSGTIKVYGR